MYIIKNAFRCIWRAKGRNLLIGLIVLLLSVSACLGLSIREANNTLQKQYSDSMEITATVSTASRNETLTADALSQLAGEKTVKAFYKDATLYFSAGDGIEPIDVTGDFGKNKDFRDEYGDIKDGDTVTEKLEGTSLTTGSSYSIITLANEGEGSDDKPDDGNSGQDNPDPNSDKDPDNDGNSGGDTPAPDGDGGSSGNFPTPPSGDGSGDSGSSDGSGGSDSPGGGDFSQMPGGDTFINRQFNFNLASMNDFTVIGYDNEKALPDYVSLLECLDMKSADNKCVISKNLADENGLKVGDTFTLKNPENEEETYTFTIAGIADSSKSTDDSNSSSNAGFIDNTIYVNYATVEKLAESSATLNGDATNKRGRSIALAAAYSGTFTFANLNDYNSFSKSLSDKYVVNSEDVEEYEESVKQLETLGNYATYFLIVIFIIGAFVLIIINLFSIRNRKYEIGVLTAIGMKKQKVALQFIAELFVITFAALIIGSSVGAAVSVPVTNKLLQTVNAAQTETVSGSETTDKTDNTSSGQITPPSFAKSSGSSSKSNPTMPPNGSFAGFGKSTKNYIASINSATNLTVILEMIVVGLILTLISSLSAMLFVMRYEPLKILNNRE